MKKKLLRVLKMAMLYSVSSILIQVLLINFLVASTFVSSQSLRQTTISLEVENISLIEVLSEIEKKTHFNFLFIENEIRDGKPVTISVENMSLFNILEILAGSHNISFKRIKNNIAVKKKTDKIILIKKGAIKGKVIDTETGEPVFGANLIIKGTSSGSATGIEGNYEIKNIEEGKHTLVVSYIGYKTREIEIEIFNNKVLELDIDLETSLVDLDDVVITGSIAKTKKKAVPVPMTILGEKEIAQVPYKRLEHLLQAKVPGVFAEYGGEAEFDNDKININVRGTNSIYPPTLRESGIKIYVDGIELSRNSNSLLTSVLENAERIEFVRGPQASTLYGSNAPSGVIQIFSKKGKKNFGFSYTSRVGTINGKYAPEKIPIKQTHSLSVNFLSANNSYSINLNHKKRDLLIPSTNSTPKSSYGLNTLGNISLHKNLSVQLNSSYNSMQNGNFDNPINKDFEKLPFYKVNPGNSSNSKNTTKNLLVGLNLRHTTTSNWINNLSAGYSKTLLKTRGLAKIEKQFFSRTVKEKYSLKYNSNLNFEIDNFKTNLVAGIDNYFYFTNLSFGNIDAKTEDVYSGKFSNKGFYQSNTGIFGNAVIGYKEKYFLTMGIRLERNNGFGKDYGTSVNPRLGFSFVQKFGMVKIKPRISYGSAIKPPLPADAIRVVTVVPGFSTIVQEESPNLKPEKQSGYDLGFDIYLGDYISLEASYYNQEVTDLQAESKPRHSPGFDTLYIHKINLGKITNEGIEFSGRFRYGAFSLKQTFAYTSSKVMELKAENEFGYKKGDELIGIPKYTFNTELLYNIPKLYKSSGPGGSIILNIFYKGERKIVDDYAMVKYYYSTGKRKSKEKYVIKGKGFYKVRLSTNYWITKNINVMFDINNLLDDQTPDMSTLHWQRGREFSFGAQVKF